MSDIKIIEQDEPSKQNPSIEFASADEVRIAFANLSDADKRAIHLKAVQMGNRYKYSKHDIEWLEREAFLRAFETDKSGNTHKYRNWPKNIPFRVFIIMTIQSIASKKEGKDHIERQMWREYKKEKEQAIKSNSSLPAYPVDHLRLDDNTNEDISKDTCDSIEDSVFAQQMIEIVSASLQGDDIALVVFDAKRENEKKQDIMDHLEIDSNTFKAAEKKIYRAMLNIRERSDLK